MKRSPVEKHINAQKVNWYFLTITGVFLNQKRINVCEHTVKMVLHESMYQNVSIKLLCIYLCLSSNLLDFFLVRTSFLYSYFCCLYFYDLLSFRICLFCFQHTYMQHRTVIPCGWVWGPWLWSGSRYISACTTPQ